MFLRRISFIGALIGIALGIVSGLIYSWQIDPAKQYEVAPWQLTEQGQQDYMIMVSLSYSRDHNLTRAVQRLLVDLRLGDKTWQKLADLACSLARTSYASTNTGLIAIRSIVELARSQGASSCASTLLPLATSTLAPTLTFIPPTPTLVPPPTKTPLATLGPTFTPATPVLDESPTPGGDFRLALVEPYCDPKAPGLVQITVEDTDGSGIPAVQIEVDYGDAKENFFTGLKPEKGLGYADYQMSSDNTYVFSLPGLSSDKTRALTAATCNAGASDGGGKSLAGYHVIYKRAVTH